MALVSEVITDISYSLRNSSSEFDDAELKSYLDRAHQCLYTVLVKQKNEIVRTGSGSFSTVAGTQSYTLTTEGITDVLVPHRVWVSEYTPMTVIFEEDLYDSINLEEQSSTGHRARPEEYCLVGDTIWLVAVPDDTYTVNLKYFPSFTTTTGTTSDMPFSDIFNQSIIQAVIMYSKSRNEANPSLNIQLMEMFKTEALWMLGKRSKKNIKFSFDKRLRRSHT